ncbi:uncharacterized protein V1513DRAFT_446880 [Lipomyces chichibuensis]|uniref:uncharacterized protein n=1 Tax=Lipomyces chichibuensis TaxID=1546026 RepID=UPI003343A3C4
MADSPEHTDSPESPDSRQPSLSIETSPLPAGSTRKRRESLSLPLPPGVLPPRKRAKTAIEKEQRRVERILRNRQAAQSSREKKRKQLEELEDINGQLLSENKLAQERIAHVENENKALKSKLDELGDQVQAMKSYMDGLKDFKFNFEVFTNSTDLEPSIKRESVTDSPMAQPSESSSKSLDAIGLDFRIENETSKLMAVDASSPSSNSPTVSSTLSPFPPEQSPPMFMSYHATPDLLSEVPTQLDARNTVAFKTMHHPAAVMSLLDLQRLLKFPHISGPWMARLLTTMILSVMRVSILCCLTWQRLLHFSLTQSLLTVTVRPPSRLSRKRSLKATAPFLTRNLQASHLIGTQSLTHLLSSIQQPNLNQQVRQRIHRLCQLLRSRNNQHPESQQRRSRIGKNIRSTSQLSPSRSSRSRHMALAGSMTAAATGLNLQWESFRLNNSSLLFSQLLTLRLCDFSSSSSNKELSLNDLRDLRRLSNIVESADVSIAKNMSRLEGGNINGYDMNRGLIVSRKYCDDWFGL